MINDLMERRKSILYHYSPYSFLPKPDTERIFRYSIVEGARRLASDSSVQTLEYTVDGQEHHFVVRHLQWDSSYFGIPTYKLLFVHYGHEDDALLRKATRLFATEFFTQQGRYCFAEIPSEDIRVIQALNASAFTLVETRLTYYLDLLTFDKERFETREATLRDAENLKRVARETRNAYDRFHADSVFTARQADEFLATYVEQSLKGFADFVMVPSAPGVPPDAFLTANYLKDEWEPLGTRISKMVLSAVAPSCKGWYMKLISEMGYHLRDVGAQYAFMHPAATNRAAIHSYEKLGCKYGKAVHVLSRNSLGSR